MISHRIHPTLRIVVSRWTGGASDAELLDQYRTLYEDPDWQPGFAEIADLREADMSGVSSKGLAALAKMVEDYVKEAATEFKTAVIVARDVNYGLARVYESYSAQSPETVRVFRDPAEALSWVDAPSDLLD